MLSVGQLLTAISATPELEKFVAGNHVIFTTRHPICGFYNTPYGKDSETWNELTSMGKSTNQLGIMCLQGRNIYSVIDSKSIFVKNFPKLVHTKPVIVFIVQDE